MGLISKTAKTTWNNKTKSYYESKGYVFTKRGDEFEVKVEDLKDGSVVKVIVECDSPNCKTPIIKPVLWETYKNNVKEDGKYYCQRCGHKIYAKKKALKTKLLKSQSLGYWLIKNLVLKDATQIIMRWDEEKNKCDIRDISYNSHGINEKGYYFKCPKGLHVSELKHAKAFINGQKGSLDCNMCNSFAQWGIDNLGEDFLEKYWDYEKNKGIDPWKISYGNSKIKIYIKCQNVEYHVGYNTTCSRFSIGNRCPYCNNTHGKVHPLDSLGNLYPQVVSVWSDKNHKSPFEYSPVSGQLAYWKCECGKHEDYYRKISESKNADFRCPNCRSYKGEFKINEYLLNNKIKYTYQKEFDSLVGLGGGNLSYDFYLPQYNLLIEYQGEQHEKPIDFEGKGRNYAKERLKKQKVHDKRKKEYANINNIKLLEIWYWDYDNIEEILKNYIDNLSIKEV